MLHMCLGVTDALPVISNSLRASYFGWVRCHVLAPGAALCAKLRATLLLLLVLRALPAGPWRPHGLRPPSRGAQFTLGFGAYLYPTVAKRHREALGPLHTYLGKATFVAGLANMAVRSSPRIGAFSTSQRQTALRGFCSFDLFCWRCITGLCMHWRSFE